MKKLLLVIIGLSISSFQLFGQTLSDTSVNRVFQLGEIRVSGMGEKASSRMLSYQRTEKFSRTDLSNALNILHCTGR